MSYLRDDDGEDDVVTRPTSSRDSGRFEIATIWRDLPSLVQAMDEESQGFYSSHVDSTDLMDRLDALIPPHRSMAIQKVIEHSSFRRDPTRLAKLAEILARFDRSLNRLLDERGLEGFAREAALSEALHRIVRYTANLYAWYDNPHIRPEQRALLREELVLPVILEILGQDLEDSPLIRAETSLIELGRRMVEVTRELARDGALKKVRGDVVLKWCRVNILRTSQRWVDARGQACLTPVWLSALANVKVRAVVFNILVDELSDDVQDRELFEIFCEIPFEADRIARMSPHRQQALRALVRPPWQDYFDLAVVTWNSVLDSLISVVGPTAFAKHAAQLGDDYRKIFASMEYALELNANGDFDLLVREGGDELLAYNMNMMAFETFDRMCLEQANPEIDARLDAEPTLYAEVRRLNALLQHNGQIGNSTTTIEAEIDENCIANEVVQHAARAAGPVVWELFLARRDALARNDLSSYAALGQRIRTHLHETKALAACFDRWMNNRRDVIARVRGSSLHELLDLESWLSAHDILLVTSWVYGGDI